jgi:site-specific recombinase XerD
MEADPPFYPGQFRTTAPRAYRRSVAEGRLTADDQRLIEAYLSERQATRQIGNPRVLKLRYHLITWRRFIPVPYREMAAGDLYAGLNALQTGTSSRGKPFKQNSKHDYIIALKPFVLWLIENGYSTIPPEKVRAIRVPSVDHNTTTPDALLTAEEVKRLLAGCRSVRDRAIVAVLYESGARIGEVARLRWRDIEFDEYGIRVHIHDTKENQVRYARCTWAREMLAAWKNVYPAELRPDSWVFLSSRQEAMNYDQIRQRVKMAAERAGLEKRIHLHLFRKSRATHMIQQNYQESVIKKMLWGNLATTMFRTYVVLSEGDIDAEILGKAGIERRETQTDPLAPIPCPHCHTICAPISRFCFTCGQALSVDAAEELEDAKGVLWQNPDMLIELAAEIRRRREGAAAAVSGAEPSG